MSQQLLYERELVGDAAVLDELAAGDADDVDLGKGDMEIWRSLEHHVGGHSFLLVVAATSSGGRPIPLLQVRQERDAFLLVRIGPRQ